MKIELDFSDQTINKIDFYEKGLIIINGMSYTSSLIVTPDQVINDWTPDSHTNLASQHINQIISLSPEIIILGTGQNSVFPPQELLRPLINSGIGFEIMDTGAACRSYNLMVNEGRAIAAGLIQI